MPDAQDIDIWKEPYRALWFGRYKSGKTWGALTMPRPNVLDFDDGIITLKNPAFVAAFGRPPVMYERFPSSVDSRGVPRNFAAFDNACRYFDACMSATTVQWKSPSDGKSYPVNQDMFDTWILDSATSASGLASDKAIILLAHGSATSKDLGQSSGTLDAARKHGLIIPKIQDYGAERSMIEQFVGMLKSSGKMLVVLCHEKELYGKSEAVGVPGPIMGFVPLLTGRSAESVPLMFHEVYRTKSKPSGADANGNVTYRYSLQTHPDGQVQCGSRLGIPTDVDNNWGAIKSEIAKIKEAQTSAKDSVNTG